METNNLEPESVQLKTSETINGSVTSEDKEKISQPTSTEERTGEERRKTGSFLPVKAQQKKDTNELSKEEPLDFIRVRSERITLVENQNGTSDVWNSFKYIYVDGNPTTFVKCDFCESIFKFSSHLGTRSLKRHKYCCKTNLSGKNQRKISEMYPKKAPCQDTENLNRTVVVGLALDLRPLRSVEGRGFLKIAQALVDFGAKHGNQDISKVIKHRTTLKRNYLPSITTEMKVDIKSELKACPSFPRFAFTFDMWTDDFKKRHFLSFTIHYINENAVLKSKLIGVAEFPQNLKKTTLNIRSECKHVLKIYFPEETIESIMEKSYAVTDGGSNVVGVFPHRLPCQCHKINLVLEHTFSSNLETKVSEIASSIDAVKSLVTYFKKSGLNSRLEKTLKQCVSTRWNSQLIMLESYIHSAKEVKGILLEQNQIRRLMGINDEVVSELVSFLRVFREISETFSSEKNVTFDKIAVSYCSLRKHIITQDSDSNSLVNLKEEMTQYFEKYCKIETVHYAGALLNPRYRSLKFAPPEEKEKAEKLLKDLIEVFRTEDAATAKVKATTTELTDGLCKKKRKRNTGPCFGDYEDSSDEENDNDEVNDELNEYLKSKLSKDAEFDILNYWKSAGGYRYLQKVALWLLSVPASSASDERVFSSTGQIISSRRTELSGSTVSDLTFIHKNY